MSATESGEILVSRTVKDLAAGSGIALSDRGDHHLKGIDEPDGSTGSADRRPRLR